MKQQINLDQFESFEHEMKFKEKLRKKPNMTLAEKNDAYFKSTVIWQAHLNDAPFLVKVFQFIKEKISG